MASALTNFIIGAGRASKERKALAEAKAKEDRQFNRNMEMLNRRAEIEQARQDEAFENQKELIGIQDTIVRGRTEQALNDTRKDSDIQFARKAILDATRLAASGTYGAAAAQNLARTLAPLMQLPHVKAAFGIDPETPGSEAANAMAGEIANNASAVEKAVTDAAKSDVADIEAAKKGQAEVDAFTAKVMEGDTEALETFEALPQETKDEIIGFDLGEGISEGIRGFATKAVEGIGSLFSSGADAGASRKASREADLTNRGLPVDDVLAQKYITTGEDQYIQLLNKKVKGTPSLITKNDPALSQPGMFSMPTLETLPRTPAPAPLPGIQQSTAIQPIDVGALAAPAPQTIEQLPLPQETFTGL